MTYPTRPAPLALSLLLVALSAPPTFARQASFRVLDAMPQVSENMCAATAISDDARIVGGYTRSNLTADGRGAALWHEGPAATELRGFETKTLWGHVRAIAPTGVVVVGSSTLGNEEQPFRWTRQAGMRALPVPPNYQGGEALGVSDNGSVVVGYGNFIGSLWNRPLPLNEAMMWVNGVATPLGFSGNGLWSKAYDVSADGQIVVGEAHLNTTLGEYMAVLWINGVGPVEVGDLPGGYDRSRAVAVSADGTAIAGWGSKLFHPYIHRMFRWTQAGGIVDLGFAPGHLLAEATGMTADGNVIVGWGQESGSTNRTPVIWDATSGVRDLIPVLEAAGLDLSAWQNSSGHVFMQATGISADGKTIVGFGNLNNSRRAWIATLP